MSQIRNGEGYLSRHLSANDYYSEGERVQGYWLGKGAERLELEGAVREPEFESLRANRHPFTGEKLTPRQHKVAFHDIVISAPKSFSITAIVGQDERLVEAFHESSRRIFAELEKHAAVRVRAGEMVTTEALRTTGNVACAVFHHDSKRPAPEYHACCVSALPGPPLIYFLTGRPQELRARPLAPASPKIPSDVRWRSGFLRRYQPLLLQMRSRRLFSPDGFARLGFVALWRTCVSRQSPARSFASAMLRLPCCR